MGRLDFRESAVFRDRFDKLGGWLDDDLDAVMIAALRAMTMYPEKQAVVEETEGIRVVETEAFRKIPALEIFFYRPDPHCVDAIDLLEYPAKDQVYLR